MLTDTKVILVSPIARTYLIFRLRPPSITDTSLFPAVVLNMHYQSGEVHVIMDHLRLTLLLKISGDSCLEPAHLIYAFRYKGSSIRGHFNEIQGILF